MKRIILGLIVTAGILGTLLLPKTVLAEDVFSQGCQGVSGATLCQDVNKSQTPQDNSIYGPNGILTKVTSILSYVVGIASVIMIIIGGIRYILASGDSANVNAAKSTIIHAIIGLIVALFAQAIVIFILNRLYQ